MLWGANGANLDNMQFVLFALWKIESSTFWSDCKKWGEGCIDSLAALCRSCTPIPTASEISPRYSAENCAAFQYVAVGKGTKVRAAT